MASDPPSPMIRAPVGVAVSIVALAGSALAGGVGGLTTVSGRVQVNADAIAQLRRDVDTHIAQPSHRESAPRLDIIERDLREQRARLDLEVREARAMQESMRHQIEALCRSSSRACER